MSFPSTSSAFAVFDVGQLVANNELSKATSIYCSPGTLFLSSPVAAANDDDNLKLRNELNVVTLLDTEIPDNCIYRFHENTPTKFLVDRLFQQKLLGLSLYHVQFRVGDYLRDIMKVLPANVTKEMLARAAKTGNPNEPQTKRQFQSHILTRTSIEDSFAVLTSSRDCIQFIFNTILCDRQAYPLLISGDKLLRDNSIILFLILSLLEVPTRTIDEIHSTMLETTPIDIGFQESETGSKLYDIWYRSRSHWASALKDQLDTKFGSVTQYLITAGVSDATQEQIRDILGNTAARTQKHVDPPPAYEK